ncbi:MAG: hypothetical protein KTR25_02075, partial [Myxococcales bacterium]|nr:hypothetical protein [Myxococcales bacterium]
MGATAEIPWVEPKFQLLRGGYAPLRDPLVMLTESIQAVFAVAPGSYTPEPAHQTHLGTQKKPLKPRGGFRGKQKGVATTYSPT